MKFIRRWLLNFLICYGLLFGVIGVLLATGIIDVSIDVISDDCPETLSL